MAGRADVAQSAVAADAGDRVDRHIHKAFQFDGQAFRQHPRRALHDLGCRGRHLPDRRIGGGFERQPYGRGGSSGRVHGLSGIACGLHSGIRVHYAVGGLHRAIAAEAGNLGMIWNIQNN